MYPRHAVHWEYLHLRNFTFGPQESSMSQWSFAPALHSIVSPFSTSWNNQMQSIGVQFRVQVKGVMLIDLTLRFCRSTGNMKIQQINPPMEFGWKKTSQNLNCWPYLQISLSGVMEVKSSHFSYCSLGGICFNTRLLEHNNRSSSLTCLYLDDFLTRVYEFQSSYLMSVWGRCPCLCA